MTDQVAERFSHRLKADGSVDSICLGCLATIPAHKVEAVERGEENHTCQFAIPARRAGALPDGIEHGRRSSDAEWKSLARNEQASIRPDSIKQ